MSAPRSVLGLASVNLVWAKVSHQPNTKSHVWFSNGLCDAGRQEVSGRNASECTEPRNRLLSRKADTVPGVAGSTLVTVQHMLIKHPNMDTCDGEVCKSSAGSKAVARYQMELMRTGRAIVFPIMDMLLSSL